MKCFGGISPSKERDSAICLVGFYGVATIVGYLMPSAFLYIKQSYFKQLCLSTLSYLHTVKFKNSCISNNSV